MARKEIPAKVEVTCDACGRLCGNSLTNAARRVCDGKLLVRQHVCDYSGSPVASGNMDLEFCDQCQSRVTAAINREMELIRSTPAQKGGGDE